MLPNLSHTLVREFVNRLNSLVAFVLLTLMPRGSKDLPKLVFVVIKNSTSNHELLIARVKEVATVCTERYLYDIMTYDIIDGEGPFSYGCHYRPRSKACVTHFVQLGGQHQRSTTSPPARVRGQPPTPTSGHYAQAGGTHPTGMHSCFSHCLTQGCMDTSIVTRKSH